MRTSSKLSNTTGWMSFRDVLSLFFLFAATACVGAVFLPFVCLPFFLDALFPIAYNVWKNSIFQKVRYQRFNLECIIYIYVVV
mmetsp:Transcript_7064/g.9157  ORF Transcript_7064/g.9157 Transcript_7064/m.9157 type:complete len:83 (-) Transcript_7064:175-423(-)